MPIEFETFVIGLGVWAVVSTVFALLLARILYVLRHGKR